MSHLKNPKPLGLPALTGNMITPMMEEFLLSFSLNRIMDLAMGKPDCDTKSNLKHLLLKLLDKCCTFILCNNPKQDIRSQDVDTILGNVLLTSFSDLFAITGKIHPMSFDSFNELFIKYVKESLSAVWSTHDQDTSVVRLSWSEAVDSIFPHALRLIEELLQIYFEENSETEPEIAGYLQRRKDHPGAGSDVGHFQAVEKLDSEEATDETCDRNLVSENQESDLKMVDEFILEELSNITNANDLISNERESDLKMVDDFISQEFSDLTKTTHLKEKESHLEMTEDFIFDVLPKITEVKKSIYDQHSLESPDDSLDALPTTENRFYRDEEASTTVSTVENVVSEASTLSKGRQLVDAEQEGSDPEKEQQSSIMLLVSAIVTKAITKSRITCKYRHLQKITERLSEKIWAEVKEQDLKDFQSKLTSLSKDILREVSKKIGCSRKDIFLLLGLNSSVVDKALISICKKKIVKKAKKPSLIQRFWTSIEP